MTDAAILAGCIYVAFVLWLVIGSWAVALWAVTQNGEGDVT